MIDVYEITEDDREFAAKHYGLNKKELLSAERLYYRSSRSYLACCKAMKTLRKANKGNKNARK